MISSSSSSSSSSTDNKRTRVVVPLIVTIPEVRTHPFLRLPAGVHGSICSFLLSRDVFRCSRICRVATTFIRNPASFSNMRIYTNMKRAPRNGVPPLPPLVIAIQPRRLEMPVEWDVFRGNLCLLALTNLQSLVCTCSEEGPWVIPSYDVWEGLSTVTELGLLSGPPKNKPNLGWLNQLPQLVKLNLDQPTSISNMPMDIFRAAAFVHVEQMTNLKVLELNGTYAIAGDAKEQDPWKLATWAPNLETLTIGQLRCRANACRGRNTTCQHLGNIFNGLINLRSLTLWNCCQLNMLVELFTVASLRELHFEYPPIAGSHLAAKTKDMKWILEMVAAMPELQRLVVTNVGQGSGDLDLVSIGHLQTCELSLYPEHGRTPEVHRPSNHSTSSFLVKWLKWTPGPAVQSDHWTRMS